MLNKKLFKNIYLISHKDLKFKLISFFLSLHETNFVTRQNNKVSILKSIFEPFPFPYRLNDILGLKD